MRKFLFFLGLFLAVFMSNLQAQDNKVPLFEKLPERFIFKQEALLSVLPEEGLMDMPVSIMISGVDPYAKITLKAYCKDKKNHAWSSESVFQANDQGIIDLQAQAPISGSYEGIDPMGLFWSMESPEESYFSTDQDKVKITIDMIQNGKLLDKKIISRLYVSNDVTRKCIKKQGIVGTLFTPKAPKGTGIITLSGSEGGLSERKAKLLASHGYTVLALAYFGEEGLPELLANIPLEYFKNAFTWLMKQSTIQEKKIVLVGTSRGGELALLLASKFPKEISGVIAYVPSSVIYGGYAPTINEKTVAWTLNGKTIKKEAPAFTDDEMKQLANKHKIPLHDGSYNDPYESTSAFLYGMKIDPSGFNIASIEVEKIESPILIISGEDDKMWPSSLYGDLIMERLNKMKSSIDRKLLKYPDAGHAISFPYEMAFEKPFYHPVAKKWFILGGSKKGNANANQNSWKEVLNYLDRLEKKY